MSPAHAHPASEIPGAGGSGRARPAGVAAGRETTAAPSDPFTLAGRNVPGLDGLRGLACLMIFNVHFFAQYADDSYFVTPGSFLHQALHALHSGSHGVDVFFVVSGYLIYGSITRKRPTLFRFILERYRRLLPVVLVINIPALYWVDATWKEVVDNVFFLQLFDSRLVTFVSWALAYEMYFYLLCGLWLIVLGRGKNGQPWASFALLAALYVANSLWFHVSPILSDWRFVGFFVGVGLAMLRADPRGRLVFQAATPGVWPVCLAILALCCWLWSRDFVGTLSAVSPALPLAYFTAYDLCVAVLVASFVNGAAARVQARGTPDSPPARSSGPFTWTPLRVVGAVSYSLFLMHTQWGLPLANSLFGKASDPAGLALHYGLSLGVSLALAAFLFMHLERPYFVRR